MGGFGQKRIRPRPSFYAVPPTCYSRTRPFEQKIRIALARGALMATKEELEIQKLNLEISELQRPWYRKPAYLFPTIVVIGTLLTGFITQLFQAEFTKFENQKHDLQRDNEALEKQRDDLNEKISLLQSDQQRLTSQSRELASKSRDVAAQTTLVTLQRKQLSAEKIILFHEQAELETEYKQKQEELKHDFGQKTAEYEQKSTELEKQYQARRNEIEASITDIQKRLVVAPVLALLEEVRKEGQDSFAFELGSGGFDFKSDELVLSLIHI